MKRIYLLMILLIAAVANSYAAPRSCNVGVVIRYDSCYNTGGKFVPITAGYKFLYDGGTSANNQPSTSKHRFAYGVKNLGPDTISGTDTIWVKTAFGQIWGTYFQSPTSKVKVGDTALVTTAVIPLTPNSNITTSQTNNNVNWCDSAFLEGKASNPVTDPTPSNDKLCATVSITWYVTGVNTVTGERDGFLLYYPNPAHNNVKVQFDYGTGSDATVIMRDVTGKVVLQRELGKNLIGMQEYNLDISSLNPGMYTAELLYNNQRVVSKLSVQ